MANAINELSGTFRDSTGKGASHRLRRAGLLPGIVYGQTKTALSVAVSPKETAKILLGPLRRNVMIHLNLEDKKGVNTKTVMVRDLQIDPVRRNPIHIDFVEIDPTKPVSVPVPLSLTGKSKSVVAGGKIEQVHHTLRVKVLPAEIPEKIVIDVTDLEFGTTPASAVVLPKGVSLADAPSMAVLTIKIPREEKEEAPVAAAAPAATPAAPAAS